MAQGGLLDLLLSPGWDPPAWAGPAWDPPPGLGRLLQSLGELLGGAGLSPPLRLQLHQAQDSLSQARALWLHLELLWRLLGELIRDPRELEPEVLQGLERALTQARLRRGRPEIAAMVPQPQPLHLLPRLLPELQRRLKEKREFLQEFLSGTPKIPQIHPKNPQKNPKNPQIHPKNPQKNPKNPPKTASKNPKNPPEIPKIPANPPKNSQIPSKTSQIPPKIAKNPPKMPQNRPENLPRKRQNPAQNPKISAQNPQNFAQNPQNFTQNPQNSTQNPQNFLENSEIPPKISQTLGDLGAWLRRERLRERRLRAELGRMEVEYLQALRRCLSRLSQLRLQGALQARLDGGRGQYLLAQGEAVLLKSRLEELRILLDTYPAPTIEAHRRIRAELSGARSAAEAEAASLGAELAALRELGPEFRDLALELGRIRQELAQKGWALRQFRPPPP